MADPTDWALATTRRNGDVAYGEMLDWDISTPRADERAGGEANWCDVEG
jgi:hypothetical protein